MPDTSRFRSVRLVPVVACAAAVTTLTAQQPPATAPQQKPTTEIATTIVSDAPGVAPRLAVPDFIPLSSDADTVEAARTIGRVLWDDIAFEREYALTPRDVLSSVPAAKSIAEVPFDRWRELGVDGVLVGTVQRNANNVAACRAAGAANACFHVEVRLFNARTRESAFGKAYDGPARDRRWLAHTISDDVHWQQRRLRGVARTKLAFDSDRSGERVRGSAENRGVRDVYVSDYDGENQTRVIANGSLSGFVTWSPDARSLLYTSWKAGPMQVFLANIYEGTGTQLTQGPAQNSLASWSPDGRRVAFTSTRDGNSEIYVMNRDGSGALRLTNNPMIDNCPTWSPSGTHIAFISDRTGAPELYVVGSDGLGLEQITRDGYVDRPTWSPAPYNQIAYTWRVPGGFEIKVMDFATRKTVQLTGLRDGEGQNESPAFSPNGRHIAFTSTRAGKAQIFTMTNDGRDIRQITRQGVNLRANWSTGPRSED